MKNRRIINVLIALFSCITLISVGFASWTIVVNNGGHNSEINGNINAEDVVYSDKFIKVTKTKNLLFCQSGFVGENNLKSDNSTFGLHVSLVNLNEFKESYAKNNNLNVSLKLTTTFLDNNFEANTSINSSNNIKPTNFASSTLSNCINSQFILNDVLSLNQYEFDIDYNFKYLGNEDSFKNNYFNKLLNLNSLNIVVSIYS